MNEHGIWLGAVVEIFRKQKGMAEGAVEQLLEEELGRPGAGFNSVGTIVRHVGGNLLSRWTDFLGTDGEKAGRDREGEFGDWMGTRGELMGHWERGWGALFETLGSLKAEDEGKTVFIRGQAHSVPEAILRAVDHCGYHVGQIVYVARMVHVGEWKWLTVVPGGGG